MSFLCLKPSNCFLSHLEKVITNNKTPSSGHEASRMWPCLAVSLHSLALQLPVASAPQTCPACSHLRAFAIAVLPLWLLCSPQFADGWLLLIIQVLAKT